MYELVLINLALCLSFLLVTILVLRKSQNISTITFSWTTGLFALSTFFGVIEELYNSQVISGTTPQALTIIDNIIFPLAPLGLVFSAYVIKNGYHTWKNMNLWLFTTIYVVIEIVLFALRFDQNYTYLNETINSALWNILITLPLLLSIVYFYSIYHEMDEEKNKMLLLVIGIGLGTLGQTINAIGIILANDNLIVGSFVVIVTGVLIVSLSFMNITSVSKNAPSQVSVN